MTEPAVFESARTLIRAGEYHAAVGQLMAAIADLPPALRRQARTLAGLAYYFNQEWAEALGMFQAAANGSEVPEDWFNLAMTQVKLGYTPAALESWQKVFDLSYAHNDAPETSTFFQKKLLFAQALRDAGAAAQVGHAVGLDLLERQLMGFYTNYHSTDPHMWGIRGVPQFDEVMQTTRDYYRLMGKPLAEWTALCDRIAAEVDEEGKAYCAGVRESLGE